MALNAPDQTSMNAPPRAVGAGKRPPLRAQGSMDSMADVEPIPDNEVWVTQQRPATGGKRRFPTKMPAELTDFMRKEDYTVLVKYIDEVVDSETPNLEYQLCMLTCGIIFCPYYFKRQKYRTQVEDAISDEILVVKLRKKGVEVLFGEDDDMRPRLIFRLPIEEMGLMRKMSMGSARDREGDDEDIFAHLRGSMVPDPGSDSIEGREAAAFASIGSGGGMDVGVGAGEGKGIGGAAREEENGGVVDGGGDKKEDEKEQGE